MGTETKQVLDLLTQGKITAEEAERLLGRLAQPAAPGGKPKYLRIVVNSVDGDAINIRVPLQLVRTGIKFGALLPDHAREKLHEKGIDLSQLSGMESEEMVEALRELTVDVDSAKGDVVRIFCE
jgi:hypothetical protein